MPTAFVFVTAHVPIKWRICQARLARLACAFRHATASAKKAKREGWKLLGLVKGKGKGDFKGVSVGVDAGPVPSAAKLSATDSPVAAIKTLQLPVSRYLRYST